MGVRRLSTKVCTLTMTSRRWRSVDKCIIDARHLIFPHKHWLNGQREKDEQDRAAEQRSGVQRRREAIRGAQADRLRWDTAKSRAASG